MCINSRISEYCRKNKIKQIDLAEWSFGSTQTISNIFKKKQNPNYEFIYKFLNKFPEIDARWLITGEGEMISKQEESQIDIKDSNQYKLKYEECWEQLQTCMKEKAKLFDIVENLTRGQGAEERNAS